MFRVAVRKLLSGFCGVFGGCSVNGLVSITYQTKSTCIIDAVIIIHDEGEVTVDLGVCSNEQSESDVFCSKHH